MHAMQNTFVFWWNDRTAALRVSIKVMHACKPIMLSSPLLSPYQINACIQL